MLSLIAMTTVLLSSAGPALSGASTAPAPLDSVSLVTPTGTIYGTLEVPAGKGPFPLVVIIAGSGPTDRNGNSPMLPGKNNSLELLAADLRDRGIASVRYDKRGIGESAKAIVSEADLRFDMYADDAAAWVRQYRGDPRFTTITIVGHSEGSLLGMLAAQHSPTDGYVSLEGAGRPADQVLREQLSKQLPPALLGEANSTLDTLLAGHTVPNPPQALAALFRPSVQPYLISWLRVNPQMEIALLTIPVLIVQGTLDAQVPESDAKLLAAAQPKAKLLVIQGMNHVFKQVPADAASQRNSYSDPSIPDAPELIDGVASFVKSVPRHR
jgi:pimeloyl-ACP methyl ester carboxylesterase